MRIQMGNTKRTRKRQLPQLPKKSKSNKKRGKEKMRKLFLIGCALLSLMCAIAYLMSKINPNTQGDLVIPLGFLFLIIGFGGIATLHVDGINQIEENKGG